MLRFGRRTPPAALLAAAGVSTDLDLTQCTLAEALTAARLCSLAPEVAAELERRPRLPPSTLTTPGRLGPRAEAAAIAALLKELDETRVSPGSPEAEAVAALRAGAVSAAAQAGAAPRTAVTADTASAPLMAWAASAGIESSAIVPALFDAGGASSSRRLMRGAAAARPIAPGDAFLAVPAAALITPAAAAGTDLGRALWSLPGVSPDDALLAWTLVDAADAGSARAPVWAALRAAPVCTGLTVSEAAASVLDGTPAGARLRAARAHVRAAFEASAPLFTALAAAVDDPASAFSWRAYAWAASAWYAFAMEVVEGGGDGEGEGGGGSLADATPALVPVAFLLNHEARHPTAVRYGVLEAAAGSGGGRAMRVRACAPAAPGEEVTLSYGPRSNADLLIFYGFSVQDNPDDSLHLEVGGAQLAVPARDVLGPSPLGPGPDLVAAGGPEVRAAARAAVSAFEAAAARARAAEVEEADAGWVESARVYCEGGAALARAVAEAV